MINTSMRKHCIQFSGYKTKKAWVHGKEYKYKIHGRSQLSLPPAARHKTSNTKLKVFPCRWKTELQWGSVLNSFSGWVSFLSMEMATETLVLGLTCQNKGQNMISEKQLLPYELTPCVSELKNMRIKLKCEYWVGSITSKKDKTLLSEFGKQIEVEPRKIKNTEMQMWKYIHCPAILHWTCVLLLQPRAKNDCSFGGCWTCDIGFFNYSLTYFSAQSLTTDLM